MYSASVAMMYLDLDISVPVLSMLGGLFILTLFIIIVYRGRLCLPVKCRARHESASCSPSTRPVSVVVYARDNSARLEKLLGELLEQDYPAGFEIIVVNDCGGYACSDVVTRLALGHNNLRMTFVPENAHNLSHRKLAITLGLKAARNPMVLLLNAECRLPSRQWLAGMMAGEGGRVRLGQAVITGDDGTDLPLMMRLDEACTAIKWIGACERHRPFRGNGYNIGYETALFFDHDGFSGTLNLQAGDDDLFISKVASRDNTEAILSADTVVGITTADPRRLYRELKISHTFTARRLPCHPVMSLAPVMMWLSIALGAVASWLSFPNMTVTVASAVMLLAQWSVTGWAWSRASRAVGIHIGGWKAVPALMWLPVHNLRYRLASRRNRYQHYTWQNKKVI